MCGKKVLKSAKLTGNVGWCRVRERRGAGKEDSGVLCCWLSEDFGTTRVDIWTLTLTLEKEIIWGYGDYHHHITRSNDE
jgi:hypothetical protein